MLNLDYLIDFFLNLQVACPAQNFWVRNPLIPHLPLPENVFPNSKINILAQRLAARYI